MLKLIGSAPQRYDTVRAALRYRGDGSAHKEISERIASSEAGRRAFGISLESPNYQWYPDGPFGWRSRAWHADDYHWRLEADLPGGVVNILASNGRTLSGAPPPGPQYMGYFSPLHTGHIRGRRVARTLFGQFLNSTLAICERKG